jgi:methionyl-tRNA formyltransferase
LIQKSDYAIDWSRTAFEIHNQIRGFFPNCVATFRDRSLKILATVPLGETYLPQLPAELKVLADKWAALRSLTGQPGEIVSNLKNLGPVVQTGEGLLLLTEVQLAGKRPQSGWNFVNGMRLSVGEVIGNG